MNLIIKPSQAAGTVMAPPSKSMAHRQLIAAALGKEPRAVSHLEWSEDILATLDCLRAMGASIERREDAPAVGKTVSAQTGTAVIGGLDPFAVAEGTVLPCRESVASLLRRLVGLNDGLAVALNILSA